MVKLHVIGPTFGSEPMFRARGYEVYTDRSAPEDFMPDVAVWMGGTDINPKLYNQQRLPITQNPDNARDMREIGLYHRYKHLPKLGICRGAQLLNVLNGGDMYQHTDNHCGENHECKDVSGRSITICSVHHQMMRPSRTGQVIAWAEGISTIRIDEHGRYESDGVDPEVIFYPDDKALCFQAHPEFGPRTCTDYFFTLVSEYLPEIYP